jgi:hypothetical protein
VTPFAVAGFTHFGKLGDFMVERKFPSGTTVVDDLTKARLEARKAVPLVLPAPCCTWHGRSPGFPTRGQLMLTNRPLLCDAAEGNPQFTQFLDWVHAFRQKVCACALLLLLRIPLLSSPLLNLDLATHRASQLVNHMATNLEVRAGGGGKATSACRFLGESARAGPTTLALGPCAGLPCAAQQACLPRAHGRGHAFQRD